MDIECASRCHPGRRPRARTGLVGALLLALAACGGSGEGDPPGPGPTLPGPTGSVGGRIQFVRGESSTVAEAEPNDTAGDAQRLPDGFPGQEKILFGVIDTAAGDTADAYRMRVPVRAAVRLSLLHKTGDDFTLALFDPLTMQFLRTAPGPMAELRFVGLGLFDIVVTSTTGGRYDMRLSVEPLPSPLREIEPNDDNQSGNVFGEVRVGDALTIVGEATQTGDPVDTLLFSCPQAEVIGATLDIAAFSDMRLRVFDATAGLSSPTLLLDVGGPVSQPREANVSVGPGTLLMVQIEALANGGLWELALHGQDASSPKPTWGGRAFAQAPQARCAPVAEEDFWHSRPAPYGVLHGEVVPGCVLMQPCDGRAADADDAARLRGCQLDQRAPHVCCYRFDVPQSMDVPQAQRQTFARSMALAGDRCVQYAEPNYVRRPMAVPDDALYTVQRWHYEMLNLPAAWDITTGDAGTLVAVLDTGRLNHPDLDARHVGGYDFVTGQFSGDGDGVDPNPDDLGVQTHYHGGHVAGTIGAVSDNGLGVAGVTWATGIMPIRVLGNFGFGTDFDISNGIRYAAGLSNNSGTLPTKRADVINMSLGGPGSSTTTQNACDAAKQAGVTVIAAAGNTSSSVPQYPASYPAVISIVALDAQRNLAPYSSFGATATLAAPGGNLGADTNGDGYADGVMSTATNASYVLQNGTSMASPHAAGVAALLISQDPTLSPQEVQDTLIQTAVDLGAAGRDDRFGHGLIDAHAALSSLTTAPPPPPNPILSVSPSAISFGTGRTQASVFIRNLGTGVLDVTAADVVTSDGGTWLTARLVPSSLPSVTAHSVVVTLDRGQLFTPGAYFATLTVRSNGGDQEVAVLAQKLTEPLPPPDIDIHIHAISSETGEVVQTRIVNPTQTLVFDFASLPVGTYVFVAGTDIDRNGTQCEAGDFCGTYPTIDQARTVHVTLDHHTANIDFPVRRNTVVTGQ